MNNIKVAFTYHFHERKSCRKFGLILLIALYISQLIRYPYLNLLHSPELLQILVTLIAVIKPLLPNFLGSAVVILNFIKVLSQFYRR